MDDLLEDSATPQQISEAVKRELSQVESMIKDLSLTNGKVEQSTVEQDRTIEDLRNHNLQLELDLTHTKLELLKLQRESAQHSPPKMVAADQSTMAGDNPTAKPTLKDLHQDPNVQSELKSHGFLGRTSVSRPDRRRARSGTPAVGTNFFSR